MILTPTYLGNSTTVGTLKYNAAHVSAEWTNLRSYGIGAGANGCDTAIMYTTATPDHLPPVYASHEYYSDGQGNDTNTYQNAGTDTNLSLRAAARRTSP